MGAEKTIYAIIIISTFALITVSGCVKLSQIVPSQIDGWHIEGKVSSLSPDSLPDRDLAALLEEYNVLRVYAATYKKSTLTLTIVAYKMKNPSYSAAFFSIIKGEVQDKGDYKLRVGAGVVSLLKGRFLLILEGEGIEAKELVALADKIASSLPQEKGKEDSQKEDMKGARQIKIFFGSHGFAYACPSFPKPERMGEVKGKVYEFHDGIGFLIKSKNVKALYRRWVRMIDCASGGIPPNRGIYLAVRVREGTIAGAYLAGGGDGEAIISRLFERGEIEGNENEQARVLSLAGWGGASAYSIRNGFSER